MSSAPNFSSAAATIFFGASSPVMSTAQVAIALLPACAVSIADLVRMFDLLEGASPSLGLK